MATKKKVAKKTVAKKPAFPKFVFIGNGDNDPEQVNPYGYVFKLNGPAVEVRDKAVAAKLANNSHFKAG